MTARSVAFLRSINVGGRRVTNDQLAAVFVELGLENVDTFLASGNVLFAPPDAGSGPALDHRIAEGLAAALGFEVAVTIRSADEMTALDGAEPFAADVVDATAGKLQVMLLFDEVNSDVRAQVEHLATAVPDHVSFGPRALFWLPPNGVSDSTLDVDAIARLVGQNTVRTANTIRRLVAKG